MKSLYDKKDRYTEEALHLDNETCRLLFPLMREYAKLGYSAREIAHVVTNAISMLECELILNNSEEKEKTNV